MRLIDADTLCEDLIERWDLADKRKEELIRAVMADVVTPIVVLQPTIEQSRWIPCSERLPELEEKEYWVCTDGGYQCQCRWTNINYLWTNLTTDWHWHIGDVPQYSKVVAWMPLPKPWREKEDEQNG